MKIAILGSTGFLGSVLLRQALEKGYQVKTLVRTPEKLRELRSKVEFVQGDIFQTDQVAACLENAKAVLSTVPPEGNTPMPEIYAETMAALISAMHLRGIKRLIHVGGAAHGGGVDENWSPGRRFLRWFLNRTWKQGLIAKQMEWDVLKKSQVDWTLVRPPRIVRGGAGTRLAADEKNLASIMVFAEALAEFMLGQIESTEWIGKAPLVATVRGSRPKG